MGWGWRAVGTIALICVALVVVVVVAVLATGKPPSYEIDVSAPGAVRWTDCRVLSCEGHDCVCVEDEAEVI